MVNVLPAIGLLVLGHREGTSTSWVCFVIFEIVGFEIVVRVIWIGVDALSQEIFQTVTLISQHLIDQKECKVAA